LQNFRIWDLSEDLASLIIRSYKKILRIIS
jgi:hypothetical protein